MILCYFNDKNQSGNRNIHRQEWDSMCVLGGRKGFKVCSVARHITLENILGSVISYQIH